MTDPAGGGGPTGGPVIGGPLPADPALAARRAFVDPGGMWMPRQMTLPVHAANLSEMGVTLPAATLADPRQPPLAAVVSLGGCTGSFVSPDGLIITNHHCVQMALQVNATPEHNYVEDSWPRPGRGAAGRPTQHVFVTQATRDVTKDMTDGLADIADPGKRTKDVERREKALVAACEQGRPGIKCEVASFYRGAEWQLIEQLEIKDVRLVHAPRRSIGNYGGEIDNWAWPRHTGDYSFLRAYVGKDGQPAEPSPDNVPYHPAHHLTVATKPLAESDFVMVAGYPGSTERITTYSEVKFDVDWSMPTQIEQLQEAYDALDQLAKQGGMTAIKAGMFKQFVQNALENTQGTLAGLQRGDTLARKQALDAKVRAWAAQPGHEADAKAIAALEDTFVEARKTAKTDAVFARAANGSSLLRVANLLVRMAEERPKPDAERKAGFQARDLPDLIGAQKQMAAQFDPDIDRVFLRLALVRALALPAAERPWLATLLAPAKGKPLDEALIDARIAEWYKGTKLTDEKVRLELLTKGTTKQLAASKDPMIRVAVAMRPLLRAFEDRQEQRAGDRLLLAPRYAVAMREALDGALAPDANSTLRITYGTVKRRGDGLPFTRVTEILAKDKGEEPFDAPPALLAAIKAATWGPYADPVLGEVPVDFMSDVDTTGGNSGSPTFNDRGELIGLLFDGTIESVSSDVVFDPAITRSIHCDIRYALWVMDAIDGADNLLTEMGVTPSL
ncbi:MAG: S46 family peptidase [Kofleriaceae bacterium]